METQYFPLRVVKIVDWAFAFFSLSSLDIEQIRGICHGFPPSSVVFGRFFVRRFALFEACFQTFQGEDANNRFSHNELSYVGASSDSVGFVQKVLVLVQIL